MTARGPAAKGLGRSLRNSLNASVQNRTLITDHERFYYSIQGIVKKNTGPFCSGNAELALRRAGKGPIKKALTAEDTSQSKIDSKNNTFDIWANIKSNLDQADLGSIMVKTVCFGIQSNDRGIFENVRRRD